MVHTFIRSESLSGRRGYGHGTLASCQTQSPNLRRPTRHSGRLESRLRGHFFVCAWVNSKLLAAARKARSNYSFMPRPLSARISYPASRKAVTARSGGGVLAPLNGGRGWELVHRSHPKKVRAGSGRRGGLLQDKRGDRYVALRDGFHDRAARSGLRVADGPGRGDKNGAAGHGGRTEAASWVPSGNPN